VTTVTAHALYIEVFHATGILEEKFTAHFRLYYQPCLQICDPS